jgi:hypothetical protein
MADWTPIQRDGHPHVTGINPKYPGLLDVKIKLRSTPPRGWDEAFASPDGFGMSVSMHPPTLFGDTVTIRPPEAELKEYVKHVDGRIEAANRHYEKHTLPRIQQQREQENSVAAKEREVLERARKKAEEL